jgi:hypothetical protein
MLATQQNRIRWMGIDMRPRWRRRVAVVATYASAFAASLLLVSWQGYGWLTPTKALFALVIALELISVFRDGGLIKTFEDPLPQDRLLSRAGAYSLSRAKSRLSTSKRYASSTPEEQQRMMRRLDEWPAFMRQADGPGIVPDERERAERDQAARATLKRLASILFFVSFLTAVRGQAAWPRMEAVEFLLIFFVIARTGPKAFVLWREPDPRDVTGEIELVSDQPATDNM